MKTHVKEFFEYHFENLRLTILFVTLGILTILSLFFVAIIEPSELRNRFFLFSIVTFVILLICVFKDRKLTKEFKEKNE